MTELVPFDHLKQNGYVFDRVLLGCPCKEGPFKGPRQSLRSFWAAEHSRGCTLGGAYKISYFFKGRKLVIWGVWGAPGAPETLQKGGGEAPRAQRIGHRGTWGRPDLQNDRFPILNKFQISSQSAAARVEISQTLNKNKFGTGRRDVS